MNKFIVDNGEKIIIVQKDKINEQDFIEILRQYFSTRVETICLSTDQWDIKIAKEFFYLVN
jgi:hypothetical protein